MSPNNIMADAKRSSKHAVTSLQLQRVSNLALSDVVGPGIAAFYITANMRCFITQITSQFAPSFAFCIANLHTFLLGVLSACCFTFLDLLILFWLWYWLLLVYLAPSQSQIFWIFSLQLSGQLFRYVVAFIVVVRMITNYLGSTVC